jgi:hypothetical protein
MIEQIFLSEKGVEQIIKADRFTHVTLFAEKQIPHHTAAPWFHRSTNNY